MQKVIAYQDCADEWRKRASEATKAQERDADERMAAVWESLARMREKQLKEGTTSFRPVQMNECSRLDRGQWASLLGRGSQ
jgi:hypothetical protein